MKPQSIALKRCVSGLSKIRVASSAGFCFGVKRAVALLEENLEKGFKICTLGEIIHNSLFTARLEQKGVYAVTPDSVSALSPETAILIRSHGVPRELQKMLDNSGRTVIDATCPFVKKIHAIVSENSKDRFTLVIGSAAHPEVEGICSYAENGYKVASCAEEIGDIPSGTLAVVQTTHSVAEWEKCKEVIKQKCPDALVFDTVCTVTSQRQKETRELAAKCDLTIVVGDKSSSNSKKLYETARLFGEAVFIREAAELDVYGKEFFTSRNKIAITAGASTPGDILQEVIKQMTDTINENLSFEEMLEQSFRTLTTGERVTGTVLAVSPAEVKVDLGTKHTGILPYDEITSESGVDLTKEFHVGDSVEVVCKKFSDVEGTVILSKKSIDADKQWAEVVAACENAEVLTGTVKEVVRGGCIIMYKNVRVFVPASQTGIAKDNPLDELKGQTVSYRVIETDDQKGRKRAVGSIKLVARAERKKAVEEFYASLEVGQKFTGTVRSLADFGAFVNIGPVDGLVHITELSWGRLKAPSELFKVGDPIEVYIKAVNPEKKRISLGYKTEDNNPWKIFPEQYNVGDVVDAKVVSVLEFGAFAEIIPGVDGLIHISQIAAKPVSNPASVLKVGDTVTAKITAIEPERTRVSLSIRALLAEEEPAAEEAAEEAVEEAANAAAEATEEAAE